MQHLEHLSKDRKLKKILALQTPYQLVARKKVYLQLVGSIISQQLSTRVAEVIYQRFLSLYGSKSPSLEQIANTPLDTFRSIGFSRAKAQYVHNVCAYFLANKITDAQLQKMDDEAVIALLTNIKGVGRWTVEMILMFTLGRADVFAVDDLGIQQSMVKLYDLQELPKKELRQKMLEISSKWKPYRTYACRYLWGWKDNVLPVEKQSQ